MRHTVLLRPDTIQHARICDGLPNVLQSAHPRDKPFHTHAESTVRHATEFAQIQVPVERLFRQVMLLDPPQQEIVVVNSLSPANHLAIAFRCDYVYTEGQFGTLCIGLEVEC